MTRLTDAQQKALRERFDRDVEYARVHGKVSSEYFLDKCGAEAGDTREAQAKEKSPQPARSPWMALLDQTWLERLLRH